MSVYLHDIPLPEALACFEKALRENNLWDYASTEEITLDENACGRVLAEPVWAKLSSPHYHASAMDGFSVRAKETVGAMPTAPVSLLIGEQAIYVDTGDPIPNEFNAVVPIENIESLDENEKPAEDKRHPFIIRIRAALTPWQHVRPMGEDIVASQLVLPGRHELRPVDLGAIAACGFSSVKVLCQPRVAVLPTGTELVPVGWPVQRGDIIEYNSIVLAAQVKNFGGHPVRFPITPDNFSLLKQTIQKAADENDLVLVNAGSSAGSEDFTAKIVEELGILLVHGVAVRPGHPVILGLLRRSSNFSDKKTMVPVVGVPGYPVSAALTGEIFVKPLIERWAEKQKTEGDEIEAKITRKITSPAGDDDYMRVVVGKVGDQILAAPLSRGAGVITSLVRADGITIIPRGVQGVEMGTRVKVRLSQKKTDINNTIFAIGSHDMTLDVLAQSLSERGRRLVSANVGSLGGLLAIKRGEAHLAGSHLLDPETGEYNLRYIRQYLPNIPVRLVTWVNREQGLIVNKGNPKKITSLKDLERSDVTYINRQKGSGTRVLFDYHLSQMGINAEEVTGYDQEEYTHLGVAAAVVSGRADTGLGAASAAQALGLDFISLYQERYDLVIPLSALQDDLLSPLFDLMQERAFRETIKSMPGYDVSEMGKVVF